MAVMTCDRCGCETDGHYRQINEFDVCLDCYEEFRDWMGR